MLGLAYRYGLITARMLAPLCFLAVLAVIEAAWLSGHRLAFVGLAPVFWVVPGLFLISAAYAWSGRSQSLRDMAYFAALWIMSALLGLLLSYICATMNAPLLDGLLLRADLAIGFHWMACYAFFQRHPVADFILLLAYYSGLAQIFFSIIYLSHIRRTDRNEELWWSSSLSLMLTSVLSGFFPAAGTFFHFSVGLDRAVHLHDFFALRSGSMAEFVFGNMQGIVAFPSYHTVMATLLIYAYRHLGLFRWIAALNLLMLLSTPVHGGHYLVDMIAGGAIAVLSIYATRAIRSFLGEQSGRPRGAVAAER